MAHRGRLYPVAFRRDFNFNCDISSTTVLAHGYTITLKSGLVPPTVLDGHTFDLHQLEQPDAATLAWGQDNLTIADALWSIRLRVDFPELPDTWLRATWYLFKYEFLASSWRPIPKDRFDPLHSPTQLTWDVLYTDLSVFPIPPNFNFSHSGAAGY